MMKKGRVLGLLVICLYILSGCSGKTVSLLDSDVQVNTFLFRKDGTIQSSIVEDFGKDYYKVSELKDFVDSKVAEYNKKVNEGAVTVDFLEVEDDTAVVIFTYASLEDYCAFNDAEAKQVTVAEAEEQKLLPKSLTSAKDASSVEKDTVLKKDKYKVLILNEKYNVIVQGTVKYFSGAQLLNNTTVQTKSNETSVVIYK